MQRMLCSPANNEFLHVVIEVFLVERSMVDGVEELVQFPEPEFVFAPDLIGGSSGVFILGSAPRSDSATSGNAEEIPRRRTLSLGSADGATLPE